MIAKRYLNGFAGIPRIKAAVGHQVGLSSTSL